jgi:hypothetical protein
LLVKRYTQVSRGTTVIFDRAVDGARLRDALGKVDAEIKNLTDAVASGVGLSSLVTALRAREEERAGIQRRIATVERGQSLAASAPANCGPSLGRVSPIGPACFSAIRRWPGRS